VEKKDEKIVVRRPDQAYFPTLAVGGVVATPKEAADPQTLRAAAER
jgi:hypothetical protein